MTRATRGVASALAAVAALAAGCRHFTPAPLAPEATADALETRSLADPGLRSFLESALGRPLVEWPLARWDLATLTLAAFYFQPSLDVGRARHRVAQAATDTAGQRPNPTLDLAPEWSSNPESAVSPWLAAVHLDWPIETAGKRERRLERARAQELGARDELDAGAWQVRRELRGALVDLAAAKQRLRLLEQEVAAHAALSASTERRVELGAAPGSDLSRAQLGWLQASGERDAAAGALRGARARVAAAIGVPVGALEGLEIEARLDPGADPLDALDPELAQRRALVARADVRAALADYAASEAQLELEIARQFPDLHLGSGYQFDQGQNKWALGLSLELPVLNRNAGPIAEAEAARSESAARFLALQAGVMAELEQAFVHRATALESERRMSALAEEQQRQLERVRAAVALGASDRVAELSSRVAWLRSELALVDARAQHGQALVDLEAAVQGPPLAHDLLQQPPRPGTPLSS